MSPQKHALTLFTKAPAAGTTKTRLTKERGGILTPQEAADLYAATLLDVAELSARALEEYRGQTARDGQEPDAFDFVISCSPEGAPDELDRLFRQAGLGSSPVRYIVDHGTTFDEHFNDAFRQLFALGYHSVVVIGGDLPTMSTYPIKTAFDWLAYLESSGPGPLVLAPCQDCGVSLVGVTAETPIDFTGAFYNSQGISALEKIVSLCAEARIPLAMLDQISDIDTAEDLAHTITLLRCIEYAVHSQPGLVMPRRTMAWVQRTGLVVTTPPNPNHDSRETIDAVH